MDYEPAIFYFEYGGEGAFGNNGRFTAVRGVGGCEGRRDGRWAGAAAHEEADDEGDADEGAPAVHLGSCNR